MDTKRILAVLLFCVSGLVHAQQAPDGLQFNVPYLCNDGKVYVVHRCEKGPKFEACFYQHEPDSERYNTREAVVYQMTKMCKVQGPPAPAAPAVASAAPSTGIAGAPQLGVYHCTNGFVLTISKCDKWNGADACWFKIENKGQVLADSPGSVAGAVKMVKACNGDMSVVPKTPPTFGMTPSGTPRTMDPAYLSDMPQVERVLSEIKGSDPTDTMARQVAVFTQLGQYIQRMKSSRSIRAPYTLDEQTVMTAYRLASYQITQGYEQSHTPEEAKAFTGMHWKYEMGDADQWARQLMGQQANSAYKGALSDLSAGGKKHYDEEMRTYNDAVAKQKEAASNPGGANDHYAKDAGSVAVRHCIESGRSEMECLGEGMKIGFNDLMGGDIKEAIVGKTPTGLRFTGVYSGGGFSLNFRQDTVYVFCGGLLPEPRTYTVEHSGMQVSVKIPVTNPPLVLSYRGDGSLSGEGRTISVAGEVPAGGGGGAMGSGMQTQTTTTQRQLEVGEEREYSADQLHQNGGQFSVDQQTTTTSWGPSTYQRPRTIPKTERCTVGTLPATTASVKDAALLTAVLGSKPSKSANSKPGLRLNGTYAVAGGLKVEFRDDSATLECGESMNSEAYEVERGSGQMVVKFQNNTGPLSLILQPNNTLTGSGEVEVTGRKVFQAAGGGVDFTPRNARCSLGTFEASR
ncbi:hypothetical protein [Occallatibacter savannae]|uniref:hypothetical protein n=1 Tax=Occallatibacter savannae TaxID=1002691 RepID=UPI000D698B04|nr:hypothetical protein [Occallatibacter savannae]